MTRPTTTHGRRSKILSAIALVALAFVVAAPQGIAQSAPWTKKKGPNKDVYKKKSKNRSPTSASDSTPGSVWIIPGQKAKGVLRPETRHVLYFAGTAGSRVTFIIQSGRPAETSVKLLSANSSMSMGSFTEMPDGTIELRDRAIHKTGGYVLVMEAMGDKPIKIKLESSADWGLKIDRKLSVRVGKLRVHRVSGAATRELKALDIRCDDSAHVTVELIDPLGDSVSLKRLLSRRAGILALRNIPLGMLGDYEFRISNSPDAPGSMSPHLVGEMTQNPPRKATIAIP